MRLPLIALAACTVPVFAAEYFCLRPALRGKTYGDSYAILTDPDPAR